MGKSVERLFPFVLRARSLVVGRANVARLRGQLQFVLVTEDLSENSREEVLREFGMLPVVQKFGSGDLDRFFGIKGAKVIGFRKSNLARSLYTELKGSRIRSPFPAPSE